MKKTKFKLTNNLNKNIKISMEPEGTILELEQGHSVIVQISDSVDPSIDIHFNEENNFLYLSLWPEKGEYDIIS
jgi:hypothetical protein